MKKIILATVVLGLLAAPIMAHSRVVVHRHWARPVVAPGPVVVTVKPAVGWVDVNCNIQEAAVFVDGNYAGIADQFDGFPKKLELKPGSYRIKLVVGDQIIRRKVYVTAGNEINLNVAF